MFIIQPNPEFEFDVQLRQPGGEHKALRLRARWMPQSATARWLENAGGRDDADILAEVIVGWAGVAERDGAAMPFSRDALAVLLDNYHGAAREIFSAYLSELRGAKEKN